MDTSIQLRPEPIEVVANESSGLSILRLFAENKWLILGTALLLTLLAALYVAIVEPVYRPNILVQVEPNGTPIQGSVGAPAPVLDTKTAVASEMEVLRSRSVLARVVEENQLEVQVEPKYFPVIGRAIARHAPAAGSGEASWGGYVWEPVRAKVSAFMVPDALLKKDFVLTVLDAQSYRLQQEDEAINVTGRIGVDQQWNTRYGTISLRLDELNGRPGSEFMLRRVPSSEAIEDLQKALSVTEQRKQSNVIAVALEGTNLPKMLAVLNGIASEYLKQNVEKRSEEAEKSLAFLEKQLPSLQQEMERLEESYNQMRNSRGSVDIGEEAKGAVQQSFQSQAKLNDLRQKKEELLEKYQEAHPAVKAINEQIRVASAELAAIGARIKGRPGIEQELSRLNRSLVANTQLYTSVLNDVQRLRVLKASNVGNVRVLDTALPPKKPVWPKPAMLVGLAAVIGALLGAALAFFRKAVYARVSDPVEVEASTGVAVSAMIPYSSKQKKIGGSGQVATREVALLADEEPFDAAVRGIHTFRSSLQHAMQGAKNNIVMLTGATPGVGKSFFSENLSSVMGMTGKRVLLIDCDLHKGQLHRHFGIEPAPGLADLLEGNGRLEDALHTRIVENVDLLPCGRSSHNPTQLLTSERFRQLLHAMSTQYDVVIIDTPPVLTVPDTIDIAPHVGTIFLVVRSNVTTQWEVDEVLRLLRQAGSDVEGLVFNGFSVRPGRYAHAGRYGRHRMHEYQY